MLLEIGSMVVVTVLTWVGVPLPQISVDSAQTPAILAPDCGAFDEDQCLSSDVCEIFISGTGTEACALACDLRDPVSCELDGECQLIGGVCDFPADEPAGC